MMDSLPSGELEMSPCISRKSPSLSKSVGTVSLEQFRAQLVQDLAGRAVQAEDIDEFLDRLLPSPGANKRRRRACRGPSKEVNPFAALEDADKMTEADVVRLFGEAVSKHNLAPGMVFSRCDQRPEFNGRSTRRRKKGKNVQPPGDDTSQPKIKRMRQKIDAALFRQKDAPRDGRPHWPDQIVPIEFKSRKKGNIRDPFEDLKAGGDSEEGEEEDEGDAEPQEDEPPELEETSGDDDEDDGDDDDDDPRAPGVDQFESNSYTRKAVRGQLTSYVDLLFSVQQRVSIFMLFIIGRRFRILRWDRAGVIVTPSLDYVDDWKPLCEFLRRVSRLPNDKLGFDPTATRLSSADAEWLEMDDLAVALQSDVDSTPRILNAGELEPEGEEEVEIVFDYQRTLFQKSIADPRWPRYKLQVHDAPAPRNFLVGKPVFCAHGAIGRGTRGYIAVDCDTKRFVWLKDAWRAFYNLVEQEGLILQRINAAPGIPGVPTVVCHGDVGKQRTATAAWWEQKDPQPPPNSPSHALSTSRFKKSTKSNASSTSAGKASSRVTQLGAKRKLPEDERARAETPDSETDSEPGFRADCLIRRHKHYRLVVREVCMPLTKFKNGKQLAHIISDCLTTHHLVATVEGLKILHRDITDDNIVIFPKIETSGNIRKLAWKGILADWEISKPITTDGSSRARQPERTGNWQFMSVSLLNRPGPANISDDLESLLLILIYYAVRYLQSTIAHNDDVATFLDECFDCYTINSGLVLCGGRKSSIVSGIIAQALTRFCALYKTRRYDNWLENAPVYNPPPSPTPQKPSQTSDTSDKRNILGEASEEERRVAEYEADWNAQPEIARKAPPPAPTAVERSIAAQVKDHFWMKWAFDKALITDLGWENAVRYRGGDRVPKGWESPHAVIPVRGRLPGQKVRDTAIAQASRGG
ncbi:hypothetical protein GSI_05166 [Ganoderma sinense ZZ0214-1]|uniref:Fungal-type protein kinase domain-containing protein n=1 Tax=Ganoderma sinense ZZ0214-1 TaxID=1077348 RepID=A0A2G8SFA4_9APHY|nr:hypothetical protein GSI_05166 [Ganoderma sinense ZZ0214-1]